MTSARSAPDTSREQAAHRAALGHAQQHRLARSDRVHHRAHVVHALLERRQRDDRIGQAGAALVEQDQPRERGEPAQKPRERRLLPEALEVRHPAHDEDEIDRPLPQTWYAMFTSPLRAYWTRAGCHGGR